MKDDIDDLDRAVVHALQVDGRASFRRIGEVLGVSDQTVARRYGRLRETRSLRVLALTDPGVVHDRQWMLRVRAAPECAVKIADALARRRDTSWISLCSGGTDIVAFAYGDSVEALLLEALPRARGVLDVRAHEVLHVFYGGAGQPFTKLGPLDEHQIAQLEQDVPEVSGPTPRLDETSRRILEVLGRDGRATIDELVAASGTSPATVRRRLHDLRAGGVLRLDVDVDLAVFQAPVRTMLWLTVSLDQITSVGNALSRSPEIAFAAATTGQSNLFASASMRDPSALWRYLTDVIASLAGVNAVETAPAMRAVKAATTHFPESARSSASP